MNEKRVFPMEAELDRLFDELDNAGRWGKDDELGTLNYITNEKRLAAARLVRTGRALSLARDLNTTQSATNPSPVRHTMCYQSHYPIGAVDALCLDMHGFALTHLDAIAHVYRGPDIYNKRKAADVALPSGLAFGDMLAQKDGIFTRGVLLNIAAARGSEWLAPDEGVYAADLDAAQKHQRIRVESGDCIFVYTGLQKREAAEGPENLGQRVGIMPDAIKWMHEREIAVYSGDCVDAFPNPYGARYIIYFHAIALAAMGLILLDIPALEPLVVACGELERSDFLLTMAPLRIKGGTGSPVNPIAIF
ncbi:MAG TPA: cyclase family protein [Steroidobacteraceae bacterium]|nr:cyclase family protein [Steroidobacteraceae bacterium]